MNKRAVIYCRVATNIKKEKFVSLKAQRKACVTYAQQNGYEIVDIVCEQGSGMQVNLGLKKILRGIKLQTFETLIVYSADRIARDYLLIYQVVQELSKHKGTLKFASEVDFPEVGFLAWSLTQKYKDAMSRAIKRGLASRKLRMKTAQSK